MRLQVMNSYPRIAVDREGRLWLAFRHRQEAIWGTNAVMVVGGVWIEHATTLAGTGGSPPSPLPAATACSTTGRHWSSPRVAVWPSTAPTAGSAARSRRRPERNRKFNTNQGTAPETFNDDLEVAALIAARAIRGTPADRVDDPGGAGPVVHPDEAEDMRRMRAYRIEAGGKTYRLLRGEFHRHTEISADGGSDGALEDLWRYAIDAADLDWIGNGDHDNGGGKEYTWWLVQKTTDLYQPPPGFTPMFTYERSVAYPARPPQRDVRPPRGPHPAAARRTRAASSTTIR